MKKVLYIILISLFILNSNIAQACSIIPASGIPKQVYIQPIVISGFGSMKIPAEDLYLKTFTYQTGAESLCLFPKTVHVNIIWLALALLSIGFFIGRKVRKNNY